MARRKNRSPSATRTTTIKPQYAVQRLYALTKDRDVYITTEVGQHQMWAAQHYHFEEPNRWMTSGGLGTMGYGLPAAIGAQLAHPDALVIDIAGEASILMNIQEMSTAIQYPPAGEDLHPQQRIYGHGAPVAGTAAWRALFAQLFGGAARFRQARGSLRRARASAARIPTLLDAAIQEMIDYDGPVIFDCLVDKDENCFPMIPSGKAHNDMLLADLSDDAGIEIGAIIDEKGKMLV